MSSTSKAMSFGPSITTPSPLLSAEVGFAYAIPFNGINGTPPYTYAAVGAVPAGLSISPAGLTGTPSVAGAYTLGVQITDAKGVKGNTQLFSLTVVPAIAIATTSLPTATRSVPYLATLSAAGGVTPYQWALAGGALPPGLSLNAATGVISGTPTGTGSYLGEFQVTDALGYEAQAPLIISFTSTLAIVTTSPLPAGTVGVPYSFSMSASGGAPGYTWDLLSGSLPTGLSLSAAGVISGTPLATGTLPSPSIQVIDSASSSAFAQFSLTVNSAIAPQVASGGYKFMSGDGMIVPQYGGQNSSNPVNTFGWIKNLVTNPAAIFVWQVQMSDLDNGATLDNNVAHAIAGTGNYTGFNTNVGNIVNLLNAYVPGLPWAFYANTIELWHGDVPTGQFGSSVQPYIMNCGGSLTVPNSFGSSSSTTYSLYKYPNGTSGYSFYAFDSSQGASFYDFIVGAWWDPAFRAAQRNLMQALLGHYQLGQFTQYSATVNYTALGALVQSGGIFYVNINTSGSNQGNAVSNASFWKQTTNPYAGMTLDQCPTFMGTGNNDETSAVFNLGPAVCGSTSAANACTYQNYFLGYVGHLADKAAAAPHTMNFPCLSYVITGADGVEQDARYWTGQMAKINAIQGVSFSQADMAPNQFTVPNQSISNAGTALIGIDPDANYGGTFPALGSYSPSFLNVMPVVLQVQPEDFGGIGVTNAMTPTRVTGLRASCLYLGANMILWSTQDDHFVPPSSSSNAWRSYIQPTFSAGVPLNSTRPSNLPGAPVNPIGVNCYGPSLDFTGIPWFQNIVTSARGFTQIASLETYVPLNAAGWPTTDFACILNEGNIVQSWQAGTYKCGYTGTGSETLTGFGGTITGVAKVGGVVTFNLVVPAGTGYYGFQLSGTAGAVTNIFAYLPEYPTGAGQFTNEAVNFFKQFAHLRWLGPTNAIFNSQKMTAGNRNTPANTKTNKGWSNTNSEGYPVEFMAQFCAACGNGGWYTMPVYEDGTNGAAGTYSTAVGQLIAATSAPGITNYFEICDELWNGAGPGSQYWPTLVANSGLPIASYYGERLYRMALNLQASFGSRFGTDCKVVAAWQAGGNGLSLLSSALTYIKNTYGAPGQWIHALAIAPYETRNNTQVPGDGVNHINTNSTVAQIESQLIANGNYQAWFSCSENIAILAMHYGMEMLTYEGGGWEIAGEGATAANVGAAIEDAGMTAVVQGQLANLFNSAYSKITWLQADVWSGPVTNLGAQYSLTTNYANAIAGTAPRVAGLLDFTPGTNVPTRNVVSSGAGNGSNSISQLAFADNGWNGSTFTDSANPTLAGDAYNRGPYYGISGYVGWVVYCTNAGNYRLTLPVTGSGTTNIEYGAPGRPATVITGKALNSGNNALGTVPLRLGPNYFLIGTGAGQGGVTVNGPPVFS
jgi:hypothetical protein